jgi:hypothetical protein
MSDLLIEAFLLPSLYSHAERFDALAGIKNWQQFLAAR